MTIYHKKYNSYNDYIEAQGYKAIYKTDYILSNRKKALRTFLSFFKRNSKWVKSDILCLGARDGSEVMALNDLGYNAIGIDLHPLNDTDIEYVIKGDWHDIPFENDSFNTVFTNSIDHCYDFEQFVHEVKRVLKKGGNFILQTDTLYEWDIAKKENKNLEGYMEKRKLNAMFWDKFADVEEVLNKAGLKTVFKKIATKKIALVVKC